MAVNTSGVFTNAFGTATNVGSDGLIKQNSGSVDKNQFLSLLITELKNQDPTAPTSQKDTLAQLAQFSSLEQMQNLNQTLSSASQFGQIAQGAALIGKTVNAGAGDSAVSGIVSAVAVQNGKTYLHIGDRDVDASTVTGIK